jgi:hypothetical protein
MDRGAPQHKLAAPDHTTIGGTKGLRCFTRNIASPAPLCGASLFYTPRADRPFVNVARNVNFAPRSSLRGALGHGSTRARPLPTVNVMQVNHDETAFAGTLPSPMSQ